LTDVDGLFTLPTARLTVRPFVMDDLDALRAFMFRETPEHESREWLEWTVLGYRTQARLYNLPYGERAVVQNTTGRLIGALGLVPSYGPFDKLPYFRARLAGEQHRNMRFSRPEVGLFWTISRPERGKGYAGEAAQALIDHSFNALRLRRIVATTEYDNAASIRVMAKLGMHIERNPGKHPFWFQVVGILDNPIISHDAPIHSDDEA
jgi:RimJ/RimL family protein N-acetyltransferase